MKLTLHFDKAETCEVCYKMILAEQGFAGPIAQYQMSKTSLYESKKYKHESRSVIFGKHRSSKMPVAVKVLKKSNAKSARISELPEVAIS